MADKTKKKKKKAGGERDTRATIPMEIPPDFFQEEAIPPELTEPDEPALTDTARDQAAIRPPEESGEALPDSSTEPGLS